MKEIKKIAIVTARAGSKRIPNKNIRDFMGKPIISYSIKAAIESGIFDEVMISTESEKIAEIAQGGGAAFPFKRSDYAAGDHVMTIDVMVEVVEEYRKRGVDPEMVCCIYPTVPFLSAKRLQQAYDLYVEKEADAVVPVVRYSFPPQRSFIEKNGFIEYKWKEYELSRSQDLEPYYMDAAEFWLLRTSAMMEQHTLIPKRTVPLILSELEVQDIDNETDWAMAEMKYRYMLERKGNV